MIKPTLFVGLGTTGTEILKTLRKLMSEEFKNSGLPIFRYVAIESREAETGNNLRHAEDYEQISVVNVTVDNMEPIKNQLEPDQPNYNSNLTDWLDKQLPNHIQSFKDGASNIRMAGRLCLWHNWRHVQRTLDGARNAVLNPNNRTNTLNILRNHYDGKNLPIPSNLINQNGINAYIVGTLCGGTCSGMLIDMAYYLRHLLGGGTANKVYGVFTMFDRLLAEDNAEDIAVHAANCYAGLSELNYYNHPDTVYDVTFPNKQKINIQQIPYDYAMYLSPTGKIPTNRFIVDEDVDKDGLNLMVALNLFAETVGDTDRKKEAIRTDWIQFGGYGGMKPVPDGETSKMVKCFASFGLTAVWYPKYRIASAAACLAGQKLCESLTKKHLENAEINAEVRNGWGNMVGNIDILNSPQLSGTPSMRNEIEGLLNTARQNFNLISSGDDLRNEMNTFPPKAETGPFNIRFAEGGKYHAWMEGNMEKCKIEFINSIEKTFNNQLNRINLNDGYGLGDVRAFFEELEHIISQAQSQCPSQLPKLNLNVLDFEPMHGAKNFWTKLAGKQEDAVKAHRVRLIDEYHQLILGEKGIYRQVRDFFLRDILEAAREKLGFTIHSDDTTINRQLEKIETSLKNCNQALQDDYDSEIEAPNYECVRIVTNSPDNSVKTDADLLSNNIVDDITFDELTVEDDNITMGSFLKKESIDIRRQMTETYRRSALRKINEDDQAGIANALVVTKAREILNTAGDDIRDLATRANPYQAFIPGYQTFDLSDRGGTKIIFGHDPSETKENLTDLQTQLAFGRIGNSSVDHLLFFYEEESSFTLDDLAAYNALKQHFDTNPGNFGHWTHKDPNFYDITLPEKRAKLERWCQALVELVPKIRERNPLVFVDVFEHQNKDIIYIYQDEMRVDKPMSLNGDEQGIDELCRQENETAYINFFNTVTDQFANVGMPIVEKLVNDLTGQIRNIEERRESAKFYSDFLREVYPNGGVATITYNQPEKTNDLPSSVTSEDNSAEEKVEISADQTSTDDNDLHREGDPEEDIHS
ncbi:hypothetical protein C6497_16890 [Candidatus Poribacteria bacterium]|nr:MAG: hypothetical protein C6497_16890 [Candidatus Poribacteria bacterium]